MPGKKPPTEIRMAELLTEAGIEFEEQGKFAGHRIDFLLEPLDRSRVPVCLDVNGDRWHSWQKIVDCDRKKLNRVLEAGGLPLGVWWSRLQRSEQEVASGIGSAIRWGRLPWWDWRVEPVSLSPRARMAVEGFGIAVGSG